MYNKYTQIDKRTYYCPVYAGIQYYKDIDSIEFNFDADDSKRDIISLCRDTSGTFDEDNVKYVYGYTYNPNARSSDKKRLRQFLKSLSYDNVDGNASEFIEEGIMRIESNNIQFSDISVIISLPSKSDLNKIIGMYLYEYTSESNSRITPLSLIKEMYAYVDFDYDAARQTLIETGRYDSMEDIDDILNGIRYTFDKKKQQYELFEMKQFVPREIRKHFSNYLKFRDNHDKQIYKSLQGVTALIYDDFYTSGATVGEAVRYLRSIHNENKLVVFNLIGQ